MQNRQLAAVSGVPTDRVDQITFFVGSGLAGLAGVALALIGPVGPTLGSNYIVDAFLVVVAGGLGQLRGAVLAAFALGALGSFVEFWSDASFAKVVVFAVIVAFLVLNLAADAPLTLDGSKLYAGPVWFIMAVIAGFVLVGAWMARAGDLTPTSSAAR